MTLSIRQNQSIHQAADDRSRKDTKSFIFKCNRCSSKNLRTHQGGENRSPMVSHSLFRRFLMLENAQSVSDSARASDFSYASEILEKPTSPATEVSGAKQRRAGLTRLRTEPKFPHELSDRLDLPREAFHRLSSSSARRAGYAHRQSPVRGEASRMLASPA